MTKAEARTYLKRAREDIRWAEAALRDNDADGLHEFLLDGSGALGEIDSALTNCYGDGEGVAGLLVEE